MTLSPIVRLRPNRGTLPLRAAVCLLLALLFLYNPFFTICMSPGPSAVLQRHASYRSTIASSELDCGRFQPTKLHVAPLRTLVEAVEVRLQEKDDNRPVPGDEIVRFVTQDFVSSLWFRPPPVL
jgi:hypothetical protein